MSFKDQNFSVLMAVYFKDSPLFLDEAFRSIYFNELLPNEIVLVQDGSIPIELITIINLWRKKLPITLIKLDKNLGLGSALNAGLSVCSHDIVIRVDSDDINRRNRFSTIMKYFSSHPEIGIVSSWLEEFEFTPGDRGVIKKVPIQSEINSYSKRRSPFNHPAVAFRKNFVISLGGYGVEYLYEDYALWLKLLASGVKGDNIQAVLVDMRFSRETLKRRGGLKYAASEIRSQYHFYKNNYISLSNFLFNIMTRTAIRLIPANVRGFIYQTFLRRF